MAQLHRSTSTLYYSFHLLSLTESPSSLLLLQAVTVLIIGFNEVPSTCGLRANYIPHTTAIDLWETIAVNYCGEGQTVMVLKDAADPGKVIYHGVR